jgi:hypothetical protein
MRPFLLGGLIGLAVLVAAALLPAREPPLPKRPSFKHHELTGGRAELNLAPRTSSVFLFDEDLWPTEAWAPAARDAAESGRWAGSGAGVVTAILPGPRRRPLPVTVRLTRTAPRLAAADDHVVDFDLDLRSGGLVVAGTGAVAADFIAVPAGPYRARIAGQGYRVARGARRLRVDLWPRAGGQAPRVRRRWPGWTG